MIQVLKVEFYFASKYVCETSPWAEFSNPGSKIKSLITRVAYAIFWTALNICKIIFDRI